MIVQDLVESRFPDKCLQRTGKILAHAFERGARLGWSVYSEFRKYMSKLVTLAAQSVVDDKLVQPQLNLHSMVTLILPIVIKHNRVTQLEEIT